MKKALRIFACALLLCLALAGCGVQEKPNDGDAPPAGSGPAPAESGGTALPGGPVAEGDPCRDFTATLADGGSFTLSEQEGKVVLLNFWATWCGPCVGELPAFPRLIEQYGDRLALVAVNCMEDAGTVRAFLDKNGYTFPVVLDEEGAVGALYPTDGIPYTVVVGPDGDIAAIQLGAGTADEMYEHYCALIDGLLE